MARHHESRRAPNGKDSVDSVAAGAEAQGAEAASSKIKSTQCKLHLPRGINNQYTAQKWGDYTNVKAGDCTELLGIGYKYPSSVFMELQERRGNILMSTTDDASSKTQIGSVYFNVYLMTSSRDPCPESTLHPGAAQQQEQPCCQSLCTNLASFVAPAYDLVALRTFSVVFISPFGVPYTKIDVFDDSTQTLWNRTRVYLIEEYNQT